MKNIEITDITNIVMVISGLLAACTYFFQKKARRKEAAALITNQIEELKDKLLNINDIAINGSLNATEFYETLDIITDNQWEKYKHLFITKIDSQSYKTINDFYDYTLRIREQLLFVKQLQNNNYINIQNILNVDCNTFILENMKYYDSSLQEMYSLINTYNPANETDLKIKNILNDKMKQIIKNENNFDFKNFLDLYNPQKNKLINILKSEVFINYIPQQVYITLSKLITKINSLEIIGCEGYKKLKKISKIK